MSPMCDMTQESWLTNYERDLCGTWLQVWHDSRTMCHELCVGSILCSMQQYALALVGQADNFDFDDRYLLLGVWETYIYIHVCVCMCVCVCVGVCVCVSVVALRCTLHPPQANMNTPNHRTLQKPETATTWNTFGSHGQVTRPRTTFLSLLQVSRLDPLLVLRFAGFA